MGWRSRMKELGTGKAPRGAVRCARHAGEVRRKKTTPAAAHGRRIATKPRLSGIKRPCAPSKVCKNENTLNFGALGPVRWHHQKSWIVKREYARVDDPPCHRGRGRSLVPSKGYERGAILLGWRRSSLHERQRARCGVQAGAPPGALSRRDSPRAMNLFDPARPRLGMRSSMGEMIAILEKRRVVQQPKGQSGSMR